MNTDEELISQLLYAEKGSDNESDKRMLRAAAERLTVLVAEAQSVSQEVLDHCWKMYQQGQISADHTAKQVFEQTLQSFADWHAKRIATPSLKAPAVDARDEYWHGRIRKWRDAFDAMHRRAMKAEAAIAAKPAVEATSLIKMSVNTRGSSGAGERLAERRARKAAVLLATSFKECVASGESCSYGKYCGDTPVVGAQKGMTDEQIIERAEVDGIATLETGWYRMTRGGLIEFARALLRESEGESRSVAYSLRKPDNVVIDSSVIPFKDGFLVRWSVQNVGFGEFTFHLSEEGKVIIDTECMGPEFIKHVLAHVVDTATLRDI